MFKLRVVAAVVCIIFLSSVILIPFANADWIMFRSDPSHSGAGAGNPVLAPTLLWNYKTSSDGTGHVYSSPTVANGVIYVSSWIFKIVNKLYVPNYGNIYALNATTGSKIWNYTIGPVETSSPAVANGIVYIGDLNGDVYALNATTGDKIWSYNLGNSCTPTYRRLFIRLPR